MYCTKCGTQNDEGAKFCTKCGEPLEIEETKEKGDVKKIPVKYLPIGCAAILIAVVAIFIGANAKKTINLNEFMTIEAEGYDGYGTANAKVDWDAIEAKYGSKISFTSEAKKEYGNILSFTTPVEIISDFTEVNLKKSTDLSNGETIEYVWNVTDELTKYVKCKIKCDNGTYKVSGLTDVGTFDAFSDVEVEFSGVSRNGTVKYWYNGNELNQYDFKCSKTENLKNGDEIEISLSDTNMEKYAKKLGKVPETISKTYTVSGLKEYAVSFSELPTDFVSTLKSESEDSIYAYVANSYKKGSELSNLQYAGYVFRAFKTTEGHYVRNYNTIYMIYRGDVTHSEKAFKDAKVYFPVKFDDLFIENGSATFDENEEIVGNSDLDGGWYSTRGYINPYECYDDFVNVDDKEDFYIEAGDGFDQFSKRAAIETLDDITEEYRNVAKSKTEEIIKDYYNEDTNIENLTYVGEYLLTSKDKDSQNNKYVVVYSANVSMPDKNIESTFVYFPVEYDNLVKLPDGEFFVTKTFGIVGGFRFPDSWQSSAGFLDKDEMYNEIITGNRDKYNYYVSKELDDK